MTELFDLFGNVLPRWVSALSATRARTGLRTCLSPSQCGQLGLLSTKLISHVGEEDEDGGMIPRLDPSPAFQCFARAGLIHGRECCRFHTNRGDAGILNDLTTPFFSCRGVALTHDAQTLARLQAMSDARGYLSPFWLSAEEVEQASEGLSRRPASLTTDRDHIASVFSSDATSLNLINDRQERCRVANSDELAPSHLTLSRRQRLHLFSAFRRFVPVNVRTRQPWSHSITDCLRVESFRSGCWCTVWGTTADFDECGCPALPYPLGVEVVDDLGNPLFLTNALRTRKPGLAYSIAYPHKCVIMVG